MEWSAVIPVIISSPVLNPKRKHAVHRTFLLSVIIEEGKVTLLVYKKSLLLLITCHLHVKASVVKFCPCWDPAEERWLPFPL